ncbi:15549_t:CDS:2 [Dentiscutata erythropus]|uniref:15549_t:CDS:1 n=1 Tax=Dentiscutata erythropus TaxID=1348616 RepID=A0A9N9BLP2_9GLOM|nr:15549_t:CDS:2 [Dentiscutata erythropus]
MLIPKPFALLEIVTEYEQNQGERYDVYKNLRLVELCQEIVTKYEQNQETNYDINKNIVHILDSNNGVPKENIPNMFYDIDAPFILSCDVSALSDSMFNSSYLEFEENQFAPIMPLRFIPYDVNPANRSDHKKNEKLPEVIKIYLNITQDKASKIIGEIWSNESPEERLKFKKKAKELKHEHTMKYLQQKPKGK